jgi:hypothetical protein
MLEGSSAGSGHASRPFDVYNPGLLSHESHHGYPVSK